MEFLLMMSSQHSHGLPTGLLPWNLLSITYFSILKLSIRTT
jgi:hypothetical protein